MPPPSLPSFGYYSTLEKELAAANAQANEEILDQEALRDQAMQDFLRMALGETSPLSATPIGPLMPPTARDFQVGAGQLWAPPNSPPMAPVGPHTPTGIPGGPLLNVPMNLGAGVDVGIGPVSVLSRVPSDTAMSPAVGPGAAPVPAMPDLTPSSALPGAAPTFSPPASAPFSMNMTPRQWRLASALMQPTIQRKMAQDSQEQRAETARMKSEADLAKANAGNAVRMMQIHSNELIAALKEQGRIDAIRAKPQKTEDDLKYLFKARENALRDVTSLRSTIAQLTTAMAAMSDPTSQEYKNTQLMVEQLNQKLRVADETSAAADSALGAKPYAAPFMKPKGQRAAQGPVPTGQTKTVSGVVWEEMSDGTARPKK